MEETVSKQATDGLEQESLLLCSSCGSVLGSDAGSCPNCLMPTGAFANLDPMGAIRSEGVLISKAVEKRPKSIVVVGVWIMFLPAFVIGLAVAAQVALEGAGSGMSGFLFFWIGIGLSIFSLVVLFKVTRNYIRFKDPDTPD